MLVEQEGPRDLHIWRMAAFLGRYGHQSVDVILQMPIRDAAKLMNAVGDLIREENDGMRSRMETDG